MPAQPSPVGFHDARLSVPAPAEDAVDRDRLTARLGEAISRHPVTLVTGAGGTGKTYAMALWSRSASARESSEVAWASLDRADSDPHRFWLTVVGALQRALDSEAVAALAVPFLQNQYFVDSLAAALAGVAGRVVLVLDDVHELAGSRSLESLEQLQRSMPEQHRLVLISRHDPPLRLHRLRLAGALGELRAAELAFTTAEAVELLKAGGLDLPAASMEHLMATTEGWAAGLRLATVAIEAESDPGAVVAQFSGRHSLVSAYLLEEVVAGLGEERSRFLMRTCVVDRICAPLARCLSDEESAGAVLEALVEDNVMVSALEDSGWYRYHPMLVEMLRARLRAATPDLATELHLRAQRWFEESGEWLESLHHAVLSGDHDLAAQVALRSAAVLVFTPERARLAEVLAPLSPGPAHSGDVERQLCLGLAAYCVGDNEATQTWVERSRHGLAALPEPRRQLATIVHGLLATTQARRQGDPLMMVVAAEAARSAAETMPLDASLARPVFQSIAASMVGVGELWLGHPLRAEELLRTSVFGADERSFGVHARVYHGGLIALSEVSRGHVRQGRARAETVLESAHVSGWTRSYEAGAAWVALAMAHLYASDLAEVHRCLTLARQTQIASRDPFIGASMSLVATRSALMAGDLGQARRALGSVDRWIMERPRLSVVTTMRGALSAEIHLAAGSPHAAAAVLADLRTGPSGSGRGNGSARNGTVHGTAHNDTANGGTEHDPVAITRGHVLLATGQPKEARAAVEPLLAATDAVGSEAWLVAALAHDRLRQDASATESLGRALAYGESENAVQGFLRRNDRLPLLLRRHLELVGTHESFTKRVLARVSADGGSPQPTNGAGAAVADLTERELSVLAYLPTLSTNPEIADQLSISVNTVKQHLKTINRKLGVSSRREAVRVARRLGLLSDPP